MNRRPAKRNPSSTQSAAQQAVLNKLEIRRYHPRSAAKQPICKSYSVF
jgi:hypothetical protein